MFTRFNQAVVVGLLLTSPATAFGEILFSDTFDEKPDWSVPYTSANQACNMETGCTNKPAGYYGFYISRSVISPTTGHGLHLDSTNKRGLSGKGLTFWDQTDGTVSWTSGMQLGVDFPARKEIYVRYWIKMQPGYKYYKGPGGMMMRKLNHISHYVYNGKPFTFFTDGGHHPTTVNQVKFGNADNAANLSNGLTIRPDYDYNGLQSSTMTSSLGIPASAGVYNYFDLPDDALPRGNYSGTGTEYNSPGMMADGKWHSLEFYLKTNTVPGVADGAYKFWLDGVLQIDAAGLIYRDASSKLPEDIWNFVHIGGNAYSPFLGLGVSGEQWYAVDDVVISTTYSGPPAKPVNVKATALSSSTVRINWTAGSNNAVYPLDGYRIRYGTSPTSLTEQAVVGKVLQADLTNLAAGKTYYFSVSAFNKSAVDSNENESLRSPAVSATTATAPAPLPGDTTLPIVTGFTLPATATSLTVPVISFSASDNIGVTGYQITATSTQPLASSTAWRTTAPTSFTFSGTGLRTAYAWVRDAAGNVSSAKPASVTISGSSTTDTIAPSVSITSPAYGSRVSGITTVMASASDNIGVSRVEFFVNGSLKVTDTTAPYAFSWDTRAYANATYTLTAKAYDAAGNVRTTSGVALTVANDITPPTVTVTSPTSTSLYGATLIIKGSATDNVAVTKMQVFVDGVHVLTTTSASVSVSRSVAIGKHTIIVKAFDAANNVRSVTRTITRIS